VSEGTVAENMRVLIKAHAWRGLVVEEVCNKPHCQILGKSRNIRKVYKSRIATAGLLIKED